MKSITLDQAGQMVAAMDDTIKYEIKDVEMMEISETGPYNVPNKGGKRMRQSLGLEDDLSPKTKVPKTTESPEVSGTGLGEKCDPPVTLEGDHQFLCQFYPQCHSDVILAKLTEKKGDASRVTVVAKEMEEEYEYPRWEDIKPLAVHEEVALKCYDLDWHFEDLVENYQAFLVAYSAGAVTPSENYRLHVKAQLEFDFPMYNVRYILIHARKTGFHYYQSYRSLASVEVPKFQYRSAGLLKKPRKFKDNQPNYPREKDVRFFQELLFLKNEDKIRDEIEKRNQARATRFEQQKSEGLLETCGCCYNDEVLKEDMCGCPEGHRFCKTCVSKSAEVVVGQARGKVPCLEVQCDLHYTLPEVKRCLDPHMFSLLVSRLQNEELQSANIPNLASCLYCDYATIIEEPAITVLKCLHPSCLKLSCRLCKSPNHLPLNCEEYKDQCETNIRLNIENMMSEAVIRECPRCSKRFQRTEGCPVMSCACGARMCYICRQEITMSKACRCINKDTETLHAEEILIAFKEAKEHFLSDHSDSQAIISKQGIDKLMESQTHACTVI